MVIVFVYAPSVYWKMGAHQNVTPDNSFVNKIPWVSYEPQMVFQPSSAMPNEPSVTRGTSICIIVLQNPFPFAGGKVCVST